MEYHEIFSVTIFFIKDEMLTFFLFEIKICTLSI